MNETTISAIIAAMPRSRSFRVPALALVLGVSLPAVGFAQAADDAQVPVFRGGVDRLTTDVVVVDASGRAVTGLGASDFSVTVEGAARPVLSADFIAARPSPTAVDGSTPMVIPGADSNAEPLTGRTIVYVIDAEEIRMGEGRRAMDALADFAEELGPTDRVGLLTLPSGDPRVDVTTDREVLREALSRVTGISSRQRRPDMSPGEAHYIANGEVNVMVSYLTRVQATDCQLRRDTGSRAAPNPSFDQQLQCRRVAEQILEVYREHTNDVVRTLTELARLLEPVEGPKIIVYLSEGLYYDDKVSPEVAEFARAAERARVVVHAIQLDVARNSAENQGQTRSVAELDQRIGFEGLNTLASASRGDVRRTVGLGAPTFEQLAPELAGYYLLSFARQASDPERAALDLQVTVATPNLEVRNRNHVARTEPEDPALEFAEVAPTGEEDARAAMVDLLRAPIQAARVRVDLDSFAVPVAGQPEDVRTFFAAEIEHGEAQVAALGFELLTEYGDLVADNFMRFPDLQDITTDRSMFWLPAVLPPGMYRLKFGVIDDRGRRGSVDHPFEVRSWPIGAEAVRISDVVFADGRDGRLAARDPGELLAVRIEMMAELPEAFDGYTVEIGIGRAENSDIDWFAEGPLELIEVSPRQRTAQAVLTVGDLGEGIYVVRFTVRAPGEPDTVLARAFRK